MYLLSQFFILLAYFFFCSSYITKSRKVILLVVSLSCLFFIIGYFLLGAESAALINLVCMIRQPMLMSTEKFKDKKYNFFIFVVINILTIGVSIYTYEGIFSLLPCFATLLYNYSIWKGSIKFYRFIGIFSEILWLSYGIYLMSLTSMVMELILLINIIFNYVKLCKEDKRVINVGNIVKK